jgi:hypothetical protein
MLSGKETRVQPRYKVRRTVTFLFVPNISSPQSTRTCRLSDRLFSSPIIMAWNMRSPSTCETDNVTTRKPEARRVPVLNILHTY